MKNTHLSIALIFLGLPIVNSQNYFVNPDYSAYYDWFHERSQVAQLYADQSELYVFTQGATLHQKPSRNAQKLLALPAGLVVNNIAYANGKIPEDQINGYGDIWFHVRGNYEGKDFSGYIWGAQLAKGWKWADLDQDGRRELIMLGLSSRPRVQPQHIEAEIRILQNGKLINITPVPGLCIFEDCDASSLLRVFRDQSKGGMTIIEASAMSVGCLAGIEKTFFYWNGTTLDLVYHGEFTTGEAFTRNSFTHQYTDSKQEISALLCTYSHDNDRHNPIWDCKTVKAKGHVKQPTAAQPTAAVPRAR